MSIFYMRNKQGSGVASSLPLVMPSIILERNLSKIICKFMSFISFSSVIDSDGKQLWSEEYETKNY